MLKVRYLTFHLLYTIKWGKSDLRLTIVNTTWNNVLLFMIIYIYCHPQKNNFVVTQLFSAGRQTHRTLQAGIETRLTLRWTWNLTAQPFRRHMSAQKLEQICISFRLFTFCAIGYLSAHFVRRALYYVGGSR